MDDQLDRNALSYHELPRPGKTEVTPTKPLANQRDLALAYSPGVAAPCLVIAEDPATAARYTNRGNLVAVVTNGTAVLGLGNIGPLAAKPVMEGKAVLFKKFAGIDVFDIELNENDQDKLVDIIASLEPTFGGINLEDIKAPECFYIEEKLRNRVAIPVFHDDQHGTAIIAAAAIRNGLRLVGKRIEEVRLVVSGAGAAAIACVRLLESMGLPREHITVTDKAGVIYVGRDAQMDPHKAAYARDTTQRTLADAISGADIFLGLSGPRVLTGAMVATMGPQPLILALANPTPEIMPEEALAARPDAIVATGRSDYPNQVNNVLCFPYMFRGALDVGASTITEAMKLACVEALAELTMQEPSEVVQAAYVGEQLRFGREYLIPKPFDPRLITTLAPAVARAAMESGVATRPIADLDAYRDQLSKFIFQSVLLMKPVFESAKQDRKRLVYTDGEENTVLRAVQTVIDEEIARPILVGRPSVLESRIAALGLRMKAGVDFEIVNPESDTRFREYSQAYFDLMKRQGVSLNEARTILRTNATVIGALLVAKGEADGLLCGMTGAYRDHLYQLVSILGVEEDAHALAALNVLVLKKGTFVIGDTHVNADPSAEEIAGIALAAAERAQRFGMTPRVALLSASNFGTVDDASARKMRDALELVREWAPELEIDGEMQADAALLPQVRAAAVNDSTLTGEANVLVMPSRDAANIAMHLLTVLGEGVPVGPLLHGLKVPAHILTASATARRIVNLSAVAAVDAQALAERR
ncbi:MAG: NADP-dependent malic enzyme [Gammaproteobacteria bacterium]|jgi:malate dehydrogenase (oxaloacetate-decarboxylating)(NADP+)|nr:NADP-dependent malic enzyme [Gammaproteobacteria bacterium]